MTRNELEKEIEETFSPIFRIIEHDECAFYQLIELLMRKGIINQKDFDDYLSRRAINDKMKEVNVALKEDFK